ncbi:MAG: hypothetical protein Q8Q14_09130 [Gemmatimonadales bacterium]|nr:hypothetical protein [Gemmatimonadales bacterium]
MGAPSAIHSTPLPATLQAVLTQNRPGQYGLVMPTTTGLNTVGLYGDTTLIDVGGAAGSDANGMFKRMTMMAGVDGGAIFGSTTVHPHQRRWNTQWRAKWNVTAAAAVPRRDWIGLAADPLTMLASDTPAVVHAAVRRSQPAGDATYQFSVSDGVTQTLEDTGVAFVQSTPRIVRIRLIDATPAVSMEIRDTNNVLLFGFTFTGVPLPAASDGLAGMIAGRNLDVSITNIHCYHAAGVNDR